MMKLLTAAISFFFIWFKVVLRGKQLKTWFPVSTLSLACISWYSSKVEPLSTPLCDLCVVAGCACTFFRVQFTICGVLSCLQSLSVDVVSPSSLFIYCLLLPPSHAVSLSSLSDSLCPQALCISVHPCMEIDLRHEYITTSHPCIHPTTLSSHHHFQPPLLPPPPSPFLQDPSLSTYLKVRISCILIGVSIFLSPPLPLWLWISGILQTNNNNKTTPPPNPPH